jgi:hypothetical protein
VGHSGGGVRVGKTTKNTKGPVVRVCVMKSKLGRRGANGFGGKAIKKVNSVMKSFDPKIRR